MHLHLKIPSRMDRSMSRYFLINDDISRDNETAVNSQWMTDIMELSTNDL